MFALILSLSAWPPEVAALGHDSFRRRERASCAVSCDLARLRPAVERARRCHPDPEVRRRCRDLLGVEPLPLPVPPGQQGRIPLPPGWMPRAAE